MKLKRKNPIVRKLIKLFRKKKKFAADLGSMTTEELLALMRHETHRIEKAVYNNILDSKREIYEKKRDRLTKIYSLLESRGVPTDEPTVEWSRWVHSSFGRLGEAVRECGSADCPEPAIEKADAFLEFLKSRRSVRVWAEDQPDDTTFKTLGERMIDAARWAPNSGNRQGLRFRIISDEGDKQILTRLKEHHCISAPLLIFVGMDTRVYGALGEEERCVYTDAGAAIMQMILLAHECGFGSCWNHFADDLIGSRDINIGKYQAFSERLGIPDYIAPVAIIAVGVPSFIPPTPMRMDSSSFDLGGCSSCTDPAHDA